MKDRFASAFDAPDPATLGTPAVQSVQSSLYLRLKKSKGNKAGDIGWLLVRAAQPEHDRHASALAALSSQGTAGVRALVAVARLTLEAPKISSRPDARELARRIVVTLDIIASVLDGADPGYVVTPAELATIFSLGAT